MIHKLKSRRAFTLTELPVFQQVRKRALNTQDMSNLRQIGLAAQMYAGDAGFLCA